MDADMRKMFKLMERAVRAIEVLAKIEPPAETPKPPLTEEQRRGSVTLVRRREKHGRDLPPGGGDISPTEFWARKDPEAGRMKRKTRSE